MPGTRNIITALLLFILMSEQIASQERPFIWVSNAEREAILNKIETFPWASSLYDKFYNRTQVDFKRYNTNPDAFLRRIPFNWAAQTYGNTPPLKTIYRNNSLQSSVGDSMAFYLQFAIDCGVLYYLNRDEMFAQCALDILHNFVQGLIQLPLPKNVGNYGWIYPEDHLYEVRIISAQLPVIYDFISPFIKTGAKAYDIGKKTKVNLPVGDVQHVFGAYAQMVINQGMTGSNWSVLEAPGLVHNMLALENKEERNKLMDKYLYSGSKRQDALATIAAIYKIEGDIYPETSQYSNAVAAYSTYLMAILNKYDTTLHLARKYTNIPLSLTAWEGLKYPNNEIVRFGDGKRHASIDYKSCEAAYYLGKLDKVKRIQEKMQEVIGVAISSGVYQQDVLGNRNLGPSVYFEPLRLLWFDTPVKLNVNTAKQPRTDKMAHASIYLQRNVSATQKPEHGLMCFVGGAHMVHGHASGMDMELYGKGQVLGVDRGRGAYGTDEHENYSRLFAAHNSVIVNGNSQSDSGWVNLGINPVKLISMEPMPQEKALTPNYSFTQTSFVDDKGTKAEAIQERTLALVRTSDTSGYYIDVFRSKSKLPNEYHDYLYHNIGDKLTFTNKDLKLYPDKNRYQANANMPWKKNRQYRHPGWHFFRNIKSSKTYNKNVKACFSVEKLVGENIYMELHIPGFDNREYTNAMAPKTYEAPAPYSTLPTPVLLIRKRGEAWEQPFVVVYEPIGSNPHNRSIQLVEKLEQDGIYKGLKIVSRIGSDTQIQYVLTQSMNEVFYEKELDLLFVGAFAIITTDINNNILNAYIGCGKKLSYKTTTISSPDGENIGAFVDYSNGTKKIIYEPKSN